MALPTPGMVIEQPRTALVITDLQNDFLSPGGAAWGLMKDSLAPSLRDAELVFCYTGGIGWDAAAALAPLGAKVTCSNDLTALVEGIAAAARPGDHVLIMSNGGFGGIYEKLPKRLQSLNANKSSKEASAQA